MLDQLGLIACHIPELEPHIRREVGQMNFGHTHDGCQHGARE
jgi:hypothetical protein